MIRVFSRNGPLSLKKFPVIYNTKRLVHSSDEEDEPNELWVTRSHYFKPVKTPMFPEGLFKGKVAFITGGGTGLGAGMATMLSSLGAKVAIVSRNIEVLKNTADVISSKSKNEVLPIRCNVCSSESVRDAVSECIDVLGLPTIVINNAAGNFISPTVKLTKHAWDSIMAVILNGTINVTVDIGKRLIAARQGGAFLNMSTSYTLSGSAFTVPSACAKSAVESFTKSLAAEWCIYGLRFNCIQPGHVHTPGATAQLDPTGRFMHGKLNKLPLGRYGEVEEVANLACYLVSDYSSWMTGSIIRLDGGEFNFAAGSFNHLIENVSDEEWAMIANLIKNKRKSAEEVVEQA
ncbi:hypothetical protein HELRODRAFT_187537 [Helobdella robusta]|uniref:2,4-dienoyl-CoA reductase, mitochondrial n=1 Tax=Helobdella robusta TaxID=6412 RepID=T1FPA5_HELRO|nr:hypothetical protein HELRODRAFT_187537 [Helobdella robusta]ESN93159.1 hypothetical protein HELRODRAFT_187537 [Helobdella robusta]